MALVGAILVIGLLLPSVMLHGGTRSVYAVASTPPPPPTFLPTPIGPPPAPPTSSPTAMPLVTATPVGPANGGGTQTPTATATAKPVSEAAFSLDAARVSKVGNPGNLQGLISVKRGSKVWLMMYYTIAAPHKPLSRTTTYDVRFHGRSVYRVVYQGKEKQGDSGRFSRYIVYTVPETLPFGKYYLHATLQLGSFRATRSWGFNVGVHERLAGSVS